MQDSAVSPSRQPPERSVVIRGHGGYRRPNFSVRDGDAMRMVSAMVGPTFRASEYRNFDAGPASRLTPYAANTVESDVQYYRRRSAEEGRAAVAAESPKAREAHRELAARYARFSREAMRPQGLASRHGQAASRARLTAMLAERFGLVGSNALEHRSQPATH